MEEYRYLGTFLGRTLSAAPHLAKAGFRATYIGRRLWICRSELDLRFATNLFRLLLMPAIRMLASVHQQLPLDREAVEKDVRRQFRTFCLLPWTSPNELVELLLGNVGVLLQGVAASADHRSLCRRNGLPLDRQLLRSLRVSPVARHVPRKLARLVKVMWGGCCEEHNETMTRTHLHDAHGLTIDPLALLRATQEPQTNQEDMRNRCWTSIQKVELLAKWRGVGQQRGRRTRGVRRRR